jgi:hypothetical protein
MAYSFNVGLFGRSIRRHQIGDGDLGERDLGERELRRQPFQQGGQFLRCQNPVFDLEG